MSIEESAKRKRQKYYKFIDSRIKRLKSYNEESLSEQELEKIIKELTAVIPKKGLNIRQLNILIDIIKDKTNVAQFKTSHKTKLLNILRCFDLVDFDTVLKVLNCFRAPLYSNGKVTTNRKIQQRLSTWLIENICNFDWDRRFLLLLPIIFNLLSIGYIRKDIATLLTYLLEIGKSSIDQKFDTGHFINEYKICILSKYLKKDDSVLPLALLFDRYLTAHQDEYSLSIYYAFHNLTSRRLSDKKQLLVNASLLGKDILGDIKSAAVLYYNDVGKDASDPEIRQFLTFDQHCSIIGDAYDRFTSIANALMLPPAKRQKTSSSLIRQAAEYKPIFNLNFTTFDDFCKLLGQKSMQCNIYELMTFFSGRKFYEDTGDASSTDGSPLILTLLKVLLIFDENNLDTSIKMFGSKDRNAEFENNFLEMAKFTLTLSKSIEQRIFSDPCPTVTNLKLIEFLSFKKWGEIEPFLISIFDSIEDGQRISEIVTSLCKMLQCWMIQFHTSDNLDINDVFQSINRCIQFVINTVVRSFQRKFDIDTAFSILWVLHLMQHMPKDFIFINNLVLPPSIAYCMVFSNNPLLVDSFCRHVDYCKLYFSQYGSTYILNRSSGIRVENDINRELSVVNLQSLKNLHNSYVMDMCNIIWRNKSFDGGPKSTGKGFMMPREFVSRLLRLSSHTFISDSDISYVDSAKQTFNLFYSPAFSSLIYGIIHKRELEKSTGISLTTPLNQHTFDKLSHDENWIIQEYSADAYDKFRVFLLEQLSTLGFYGVPELLFSSLKSLSKMKSKGYKRT